jgi:hypothetical protein
VRRVLFLTSAIVLVDTLFFAALTPLLPHYAHTLGLGKAGAGVLTACYPLGALAGATAVPLFLDPGFLDAVGREGGRTGFGDRTRAMGQLFGDLLPEPVLARSSKAEFTRVFWGEACAEFARTWTGEGVDHDLVDAAALARTWKEGPGATALGPTGLLLQSAWLTSHAARR